MGDEKRVKDIMAHIDEYDRIDQEAPLCDALAILKRNHEKIKAGDPGRFHKTLLVTDTSNKIVGKFSIYDLIRGLVPEPARKPEVSRSFYSVLSSRALEVSDDIGKIQERFAWLGSTLLDLTKRETQKKIKEVMSPIHPLLVEDDTVNKAIYVMFKENIRQPLVTRGGKIVGVINIMDIFPELLNLAGDVCTL